VGSRLKGDKRLSPFLIFIIMAAEQSQFSKLPKKQLFRIAEKLIDEDFDTGNPYATDYDSNYKILESIGKYFNMNVVDEDVQFFAKFLDINDGIISKIMEKSDILSYEDLIIPTAKSYRLFYETWGTCSYIDYLRADFDSYDKDWVEDSAKQQSEDGNWDIWDGTNYRDTTYENFEVSDYEFTRVSEINDNPTVTTESSLNRLVLENTSKVVSSLDKKTLLKLKQIIESRLRSL
jgi:hypothetical protein